MSTTSANEVFNKSWFIWEDQEILALNKKNPTEGLLNVIQGFDNRCYGVFERDNNEAKPAISVFFILYVKELKGYVLNLVGGLSDHELNDHLVFLFSQMIIEEIDHNIDIDIFDVFHTLQSKRRVMLEMLDYTTINPSEMPKGSTLLVASKGIIPLLKIDKVDFYTEIIKPIIEKRERADRKQVYLMLDAKTGMFKIGQSVNPSKREKTLQSEKAETHLIASWNCDKKVEKELHRKYKTKRKRGEWFRLSIKDLDDIRDYMNGL